ncbi:hypothetical protein RDWZM_002003 [Blomia tropicalis]|uniref:Beta-lactamase-like protein 2 homolog n=1 Tax=Blomia tropicalis TaxID=40697 RepID=A0A9Q0MBT1_BLOTA|nr:Beta-lactamase-like protein 2 [Blomia tropicalis]KAJ6223458.1 hypothetical protein RDWZM_002003 [Blomia tropicalis]
MSTIIPKITQLSSRVIRVLGCNPGYFTLQGTNTYIVGTGKQRALIDCGEPGVPEYIETLKGVLKDRDISLSKIIITHWHPDHVGGTYEVLNNVTGKDCKVFKYKNTKNDPLYSELFELNYLNDEEEVELEGATMKMYLTPGHARDHLSIHLKEENTLFSGDCILGEGTVVFEDLLTYLKSLDKIKSLNSEKLYPGHGPVVDDPIAKVEEYVRKRMARENDILAIMRKADSFLTTMEIAEGIYVGLPTSLMFGAEHNVRMHLEKLVKEDRIEAITIENVPKEKTHNITKYRLKH